MHRQVSEMLQRAYRPYPSLPELLGAFVKELSEHKVMRGGQVRLRSAVAGATAALSTAAGDRGAGSLQRVPIRYGGEVLGELHLEGEAGRLDGSALALGEQFAQRCAHLIKRYEAKDWAEQALSRPLLLVGAGEALKQMDEFVERAAASPLPVLLRGEFGTEKMELAAALHSGGPYRQGPFVEVNCVHPQGEACDWFARAQGGTLYFHEVDELPVPLQGQLSHRMRGLPAAHADAQAAGSIRVIASTSADLEQRVREKQFSRALLAGLEFLTVDIPPLRERVEDIAALAARSLELHGFNPHVLGEDVLEALCAHDWPGNLLEMERVVVRLAVMTGGRCIRREDLVRHAPDLAAASATSDAGRVQQLPPGVEPAAAPGPGREEIPRAAHEGLHDGLKRALAYLKDHAAEPLTLGDLARQAHVSQSHLGFLFRSELGTTFKLLLQQLRIEHAKQLLRDGQRLRITDVALQVGFGDLSHFEKSFRRAVGVSPRSYRRTADQ
ncbi:helix-turn-helix domain-containing protein [Stenotrophomonas maltophilia]|uniref:helix-turn-helix domain-containing protein n=1 Tax=Stenotrophomonas maltophilia TaxID=40324 RepID=UPI0021CAB576|nr:helix-turn-helix domain-containing protein [Stenotrophomonas maltophilia]MCU1067872.1 helix-turn-helix domain-containing protein [Stenotrophomonas maltophilia]MCU1074735.1 helix-turn-helix domain-containing protein [Stenotrophomonas maltophilia]MCU1139969.1 helix-turn-helix domain-containing protein [Stenotrophomonas maltophilia]